MEPATNIKPGWYVNKHDTLDVVMVTERTEKGDRQLHQVMLSYKSIERNRGYPAQSIVGPGFEQYYRPVDPKNHAKRLHNQVMEGLVLSEAIRDVLAAMGTKEPPKSQ